MSVPLFIVDAFTRTAFTGNPAAVCLLPAWPGETWMQALAAEMNLAETAFVVPDGSRFGLRWFTPAVEVPLCGHATLASAHVLFETQRVPAGGTAAFLTASGELRARRAGDRIDMDFPSLAVSPCDAPPALVAALGLTPAFVGCTVPPGPRGEVNYLCELNDADTVRALNPDFSRLRTLDGGVIVTARAPGGVHAIVSRYFAPGVGIDEDPVTGSAHCALAPYWAPRLGRDHFLAWQASARGGELELTLRGERVQLAGHAVTVLAGECRVQPAI